MSRITITGDFGGFLKMKRTLLLAASAAVLAAPTIAQELPPGNPLPGECFARVIVPAQYQTSTEQVVLRQAGEEIKKIPAQLETVTERVLVQEESYELFVAGAGGGGIVPGRGRVTVTINGTPYTIDSSRTVTNASGARIGTVDPSGNIVATNGSVLAANAVNPLTLIGTGSSRTRLVVGGTTYSVASDGRVYNASGSSIGSIDGSGNIVASGGRIVSRSAVNAYSGGGSTSGQASFRTVTETVVVQEASTELVAIPPVYETVSETVVVQPESVEYTTIPATYENYTETVVVQEASTELVTVPPVFETVQETVVAQEASTELVTIPATYETVSETVVVQPASVEYTVVPATYETQSETVVIQDATTELVTIPSTF